MPSTSAPSEPPAVEPSPATDADRAIRVVYFDGLSAVRRPATLTDDGATFRLIEADRESGPFAFAELTASDARPDSYGIKRVPGWRIDLVDGADMLAGRLPGAVRYGRMIDRIGLWPAVGVFAAATAATVIGFLQVPALVARVVPASVETRLGDVMMGDFGRSGCSTPEGDAALEALVKRVDPDDRTLEVHVVKLPIVNAVTLPGGRIVLFDGLIAAAGSPDAVAGVLAHEIGHVRSHDVMESLLRQIGLSVLLGGLEGHVGGYTNTLLAATYSRKTEARADGYAMTMLREAKISPVPTGAFFAKLGGKSDKAERMFAYLASHPVSADRARAFAASATKGTAYGPTLDARQWTALRAICAKEKTLPKWRF